MRSTKTLKLLIIVIFKAYPSSSTSELIWLNKVTIKSYFKFNKTLIHLEQLELFLNHIGAADKIIDSYLPIQLDHNQKE